MTLETHRNAALTAWYAAASRDLPWRRDPSPYRVLVSEVMLQQTQVDRVVPYFERFVEAFPSVTDLAAAPLAGVLELWSGLGYNSRAKRLHDAAKVIAKGGWPGTIKDLEGLPGVGPYTARAIGAFAFGWPVVPTDTNLKRVLSRWHGEPLDGSTLQTTAEADANRDTSRWAQAVMDLGAQLCRPRDPRCDECPVEAWCEGPDVYIAPRTQPKFEGSVRQLRGAILRTLLTAPSGVDALTEATGFDGVAVARALDDLADEGLVTESAGEYRLPSS